MSGDRSTTRAVVARRVQFASLALLLTARGAAAQTAVPAATPVTLHGTVTVTNNGMSPIPSLSLGRPAAMLELAAARGRASFEPQFRMGLDGRPWSFIFWGRYRAYDGDRLHVQLGAHPAFAFRTVPAPLPGGHSTIAVRRFLASELNANYALAPHVSVGTYAIFAYGVEPDAARHTYFWSARMAASGLPLGGAYALRLNPQIFVLHLDRSKGYYVNGAATVTRAHSPVSFGASVNQSLQTSIAQGKGLIWNVSAMYAL